MRRRSFFAAVLGALVPLVTRRPATDDYVKAIATEPIDNGVVWFFGTEHTAPWRADSLPPPFITLPAAAEGMPPIMIVNHGDKRILVFAAEGARWEIDPGGRKRFKAVETART